MTRIPLTPRPRVPVLVHATALSTLAFASAACGDDGSGTTATSAATTDVAPTAGPCYHQNPPPPECASTGLPPGTTGSDTGSSTGSSSVADSATDVAPTAGPCFHPDPPPECASSTGGSSDSGTTDATGTGTGTGTGTSSG
jgi:hypothetical protein